MTTGILIGAVPSPRFAFTRSYISQLGFYGSSNDIDQSGDQFTVWLNRTIGYGIVYVLYPNILPWNSNHYTLDHVVYDCWWIYNFDGVHHPQFYSINWWWRGTPELQTISIVEYAGGAMEKFYTLGNPPSTYWLPEPLR